MADMHDMAKVMADGGGQLNLLDTPVTVGNVDSEASSQDSSIGLPCPIIKSSPLRNDLARGSNWTEQDLNKFGIKYSLKALEPRQIFEMIRPHIPSSITKKAYNPHYSDDDTLSQLKAHTEMLQESFETSLVLDVDCFDLIRMIELGQEISMISRKDVNLKPKETCICRGHGDGDDSGDGRRNDYHVEDDCEHAYAKDNVKDDVVDDDHSTGKPRSSTVQPSTSSSDVPWTTRPQKEKESEDIGVRILLQISKAKHQLRLEWSHAYNTINMNW